MFKKMIILKVATILFYFSSICVYGQSEVPDLELKKFGMGIHIEQFKLTDITSDIELTPANKIVFTITPNKNFRIEPELGFLHHKDKDAELVDKSIHFGTGIYGMLQKGKTNIYGGIKCEYVKITNEYEDWNTGEKHTIETKRSSIGPTIGVEYFFGKHFSFGGELGLKFMFLNSNDDRIDEESKQNYSTTDSGLLIRFYF